MKKEYIQSYPFSEGLAAVKAIGGARFVEGFVDKTGTEVIRLKYESVGSFKLGLALVCMPKSVCFYIDKKGTEYYEPDPQKIVFVAGPTSATIIGFVDIVDSSGAGCKVRIISGENIYSGIISLARLSALCGCRITTVEEAIAFLGGQRIRATVSGLQYSQSDPSNVSFRNVGAMTIPIRKPGVTAKPVWNERKTSTETVIDLSADILFDFNKATINPYAVPTLIRLARAIRQSNASGIELNGFTDSIGGDEYNLGLSERRAAAVKDWLVRKGGIAPNRLSTNGYGKSQPVAPNTLPNGADNPAGRQKNRRVEIRIPRN